MQNSRRPVVLLNVFALALAVCATGPGIVHAQDDRPTHAEATAGPRIFAHYMVCYFNSVDFYKQEIELAQRHGIEGFALNCGQWLMRGRDALGEPAAGSAGAATRSISSGSRSPTRVSEPVRLWM